MIEIYVPIFLTLIVMAIFAIVSVNMSWLLGPARPNKEKHSTYESGMEPISTAHERFSVKFYMVALSFIIFDVEIVFMYPWAVRFQELGMPGFVVMSTFVFILVVGYIYELKKGALQWD